VPFRRFPSKRGAALPSLLAPFFKSLPLQTNKQQVECSLSKRPFLSVDLDTKAHVPVCTAYGCTEIEVA
jgi:hypothetical protein